MNNRHYENEISISGLFLYCISKWRSIFIFMIVFALLAGGFKAFQGAAPKSVSEKEKNAEAEYYAGRLPLSENRLKELYDYVEKSEIMKMNPHLLYQATINYKINAPETELDSIMASLSNFVLNGGLSQKIEDRTDIYTSKDFQHLISFTGKIQDEIITEQSNFTISVSGKNQEEAEKLNQYVKEEIDVFAEKLKAFYALDSIEEIDSVICEISSQELEDYQKSIYDAIYKEKDVLANLKKLLGEMPEEEAAVPVSGSKKEVILFAGIGAVAGMLLAFFVWGAVFVLGGRLYSVLDIEKRFDLPVFGTVASAEKKGFLDQMIARKRGGVYASMPVQEQKQLVLFNIKNELKKDASIHKVLLSGSLKKENLGGMAKWLHEELQTLGYQVENYINIPGSAKDMEKVKDCDAVILLENREISKSKMIHEEIAVLKAYAGEVKGIVLI